MLRPDVRYRPQRSAELASERCMENQKDFPYRGANSQEIAAGSVRTAGPGCTPAPKHGDSRGRWQSGPAQKLA